MDLKQQLGDLAKAKFDNVVAEYDAQLSLIESRLESVETQMDIVEAQGHFAGKKYFETLMQVERENVNKLQQEYNAVQHAFQEAMATGSIEANSEAYYDMQQQIADVGNAWQEAQLQLQEYQNQMREMDWSIFERLIDQIDQVNSESDFLVELLRFNESELFDKKTGQFTDKANAVGGLYAVKYNTYMAQADEYKKKLAELDAEIAKDPANTILLDKRQEYLDQQREAIKNANDEKKAIRDLYEESYKKMLEILQKLIEKRRSLLESTKDLYDYEKSMKNHNKNITDLEKQLSALSGDNSEESISKKQQLQTQLEEARQAQEEEMYSKYLEDQNKAMDLLYENYERLLNERLDNIDGLVSEMIDTTNKNSGAIRDTITQSTDKVGYDITNGMKDIWLSGTHSVVSEYKHHFTNTMTTTNGYIQEIRDLIRKSIDNNVSISRPKNIARNGFANGGLIGRAIRDAEGINGGFILAHSGEYVLNEKQLGIADHMVSNLVNFAKLRNHAIGKPNLSNSSRIDKFEMNINLPNVNNYDDFKDALVRDKKIQNIIQDITIGNALGKNSLNKYKHK